MASHATRKIIAAAPQLSEPLLVEFMEFLSTVGEKVSLSDTRYYFMQEMYNFWGDNIFVPNMMNGV